MPRVTVVLDTPVRAGVVPTAITPTTDGIAFVMVAGKTCVLVDNSGGASEVTTTLKIGQTVLEQAVASIVITVAAGAKKIISGFLNELAQPTDGSKVHIDFAGDTLADCDVFVFKAT